MTGEMRAPASRPVILTFNRTYLPGYKGGGPIRTIANMVEQLGDRFDFRIITQDRDAGDTGPYPGIEAETWVPQGKGSVYYFSPSRISVRRLASLICSVKYDVLYLNSFFDRVFTTRVLAARGSRMVPRSPIILAPRGEFSAGALRYKRLRKQAYLQAFRTLFPWRTIVWQASTRLEKEDVRRALPGIREEEIRVACDLAAASPAVDEASAKPRGGPLRLLFLSRISPMKNLLFVLEVLARVHVPVVMTIAGPRDDEYWHQCEPLMKRLPANVAVTLQGPVPPSEVLAVMRRHDLFFLPTLGENFGHVIHEALSAGLPILISDRTPWNSVNEAGAGWAIPLDNKADFVRVIESVAAMTPEQLLSIRRICAEYARQGTVVRDAIEQNTRLFAELT